jgi:hypothetical protein
LNLERIHLRKAWRYLDTLKAMSGGAGPEWYRAKYLSQDEGVAEYNRIISDQDLRMENG